jgi:hypothetical protein
MGCASVGKGILIKLLPKYPSFTDTSFTPFVIPFNKASLMALAASLWVYPPPVAPPKTEPITSPIPPPEVEVLVPVVVVDEGVVEVGVEVVVPEDGVDVDAPPKPPFLVPLDAGVEGVEVDEEGVVVVVVVLLGPEVVVVTVDFSTCW